jgi:hypothetical protein
MSIRVWELENAGFSKIVDWGGRDLLKKQPEREIFEILFLELFDKVRVGRNFEREVGFEQGPMILSHLEAKR